MLFLNFTCFKFVRQTKLFICLSAEQNVYIVNIRINSLSFIMSANYIRSLILVWCLSIYLHWKIRFKKLSVLYDLQPRYVLSNGINHFVSSYLKFKKYIFKYWGISVYSSSLFHVVLDWYLNSCYVWEACTHGVYAVSALPFTTELWS